MFEELNIYQEFCQCFDYTTRLIYIKKNSTKINPRFVDLLSLNAKVLLDEGEVPLAIELADLALTASSYIEDKRVRGASLILKSQLLQIQNGYNEAENLLFEAKEIYEKEGMEEKLCDVFNLIGYLYKSQKKYEQAIRYYRKAIDLSRKLNKKTLYALNLSAIGEIEYHKTRPQQALWHFEQSLRTYEEIGEKKSQSQILNWVGYININLKNYEEASKNFLKVLELLEPEKSKIISSLAYARFHLGTINQHLDKPEEALRYLLSSLKIWKNRESLQVCSEMCFYWGNIYKSLNLKDKAIEFFKCSLQLLQVLGTRKGTLSLIFQIRNLEPEEEPSELIHSYFAKRLSERAEEKDINENIYLFNVISKSYREFTGRDEKLIYFTSLKPSFSKKFNLEGVKDNQRKHMAISQAHLSIAFRQVANIYSDREETVHALPYIIELLEIKQKFYHSTLVKKMLEGLWDLSFMPGKEENYSYYNQEILRLLNKFVSNSDQALITYETGLIYFARDRYKKARELFLRSFDICSRFKNKEAEARVCRALAWSRFKAKDLRKSIIYLQRALKIDERFKQKEELLDLLLLGRFYMEKKEIVKSLEYQSRARIKANSILCEANPLINLKSRLIKSDTMYQFAILCKREINPSMLQFKDIFEPVKGCKSWKKLEDIVPDLISEESFWKFLSYQYLAMKNLSKSNLYEVTHFLLKALKEILFLPVKESQKIYLLRLGLLYQTLGMPLESKWHLRLVDEYYRDLVFEENSISPFSYRASVLFNISVLFCLKKDFSKSITALLEAEDIEQIEKNHLKMARIYYQNGITREYQSNDKLASVNYNRALEIYLALEDNAGIARCLNKLALINPESKKEHFLSALALINPEENPLLYGQVIFNWAVILKKEGNFLWESLDAHKESLKYFRKTGFLHYSIKALYSLIELTVELGQEDMTTWYLEEAWKLLKKRIPPFLFEKISLVIEGGFSIRKQEDLLYHIQNIYFFTPSLVSAVEYLYQINAELSKVFLLLEDEEKSAAYDKGAKDLKRQLLDICGYDADFFYGSDDKEKKCSSFDIIMYNEKIFSNKNKKSQPQSLKNKILPLLDYLKNLKENETLIKKYISEVITDMKDK